MNEFVYTVVDSIPDPETVTPGPLGFLAILFVAVAVILLGLDMVRRIRRTTYRSEIQARLREEMAARDDAARDPKTDRPE